MPKKKRIAAALLPLLFLLTLAGTGCADNKENDMTYSYTQIDQETAKEMMVKEDGHVIVDVRQQDEYDAGHIPGAILIPNESIGTEPPAELPDLDQIILIYCRSGNRSKQAAGKLAAMGYTHLYEFGGINTWTGEIVKESVKAVLQFESFDGGGPTFNAVLDTDIVSCVKEIHYGSADHEELDGAAFAVLFTFTGLKPGETTMTIEQRSPIAENFDHLYSIRVDRELNVTLELLTSDDLNAAVISTPILVIRANDRIFYAELEDNSSARAFLNKLNPGSIEVAMHDYGGFEKVGALPWDLPQNDEKITTEPGDVILYQGNQITVYYDANTWSFTRLARIEGVTRDELLEAFGDGDVTVCFWLEWSE